MKFTSLSENANCFENSSDLIYGTKLELRTNVNHIIDDNIARFPKALQAMDKYQLGVLLQGTINDAIRRIRRNYKTKFLNTMMDIYSYYYHYVCHLKHLPI